MKFFQKAALIVAIIYATFGLLPLAFANSGVDTRAERLEAVIQVNQSVCVLIYIMPASTPKDELYITLERASSEGVEVILDDHNFDSSEAIKGETFFAVADICTPVGSLSYKMYIRSEN